MKMMMVRVEDLERGQDQGGRGSKGGTQVGWTHHAVLHVPYLCVLAARSRPPITPRTTTPAVRRAPFDQAST